MRVAHWSY